MINDLKRRFNDFFVPQQITIIIFLFFVCFDEKRDINFFLRFLKKIKNNLVKYKVLVHVLPFKHCNPVHPASHPLSHPPVTWLQGVSSLQCPTHG